MSDIENRITDYLRSGGLCNPELAIHDRVRDLIIDCRAEVARLRLTDAEREAVQICVERMQDSAVKSRRDAAATLRALLARLGGAS